MNQCVAMEMVVNFISSCIIDEKSIHNKIILKENVAKSWHHDHFVQGNLVDSNTVVKQ